MGRRGKRYHWLDLPKEAPQPEAQWQETGDFIDADDTMRKAFYDYFLRNKLLSHLH